MAILFSTAFYSFLWPPCFLQLSIALLLSMVFSNFQQLSSALLLSIIQLSLTFHNLSPTSFSYTYSYSVSKGGALFPPPPHDCRKSGRAVPPAKLHEILPFDIWFSNCFLTFPFKHSFHYLHFKIIFKNTIQHVIGPTSQNTYVFCLHI